MRPYILLKHTPVQTIGMQARLIDQSGFIHLKRAFKYIGRADLNEFSAPHGAQAGHQAMDILEVPLRLAVGNPLLSLRACANHDIKGFVFNLSNIRLTVKRLKTRLLKQRAANESGESDQCVRHCISASSFSSTSSILSIFPPKIEKHPGNSGYFSNRIGRPSSASFFIKTVLISNREPVYSTSRTAGR